MPRISTRPLRFAGGLIVGGLISGCFIGDTTDLRCWTDDDCLNMPCIGQICTPSGGTRARHVAVGPAHVCAVLGDGSARCWGENSRGQLGYLDHPSTTCVGTGMMAPLTPSALGPLDLGPEAEGLHVLQIAAGGSPYGDDITLAHTCALLSNGRLKCWGPNSFTTENGIKVWSGWLGYENGLDVLSPATAPLVPLVPKVHQLALGNFYTCVVREDGKLACWGMGAKPLGKDNDATVGNAPDQIQTLIPIDFGANESPVIAVSTGYEHACAVLEDRTAWCWGVVSNPPAHGELGVANVTNGALPLRVSFAGFEGAPIDVRTGLTHTCALLDDDTVACWGCNDLAQLGHPALEPFLNCNGGGAQEPVPATTVQAALAGERIVQLTSGANHNCVLLAGGAVHCWGDNSNGQLGSNDSTAASAAPREVELGGSALDAIQISSAGSQTCAVIDSGDIVCWGDNLVGQAGRGTCAGSSTLPARVILQ